MAIQNLYVDLENGVDTEGTGKNTTWSNPSGTTVRGTSTAHGFANNDWIRISPSSAVNTINGFVWQVTNVTANTFDLVDAVWPGSNTTTNCYKLTTGLSASTPRKTMIVRRGGFGETRVKKTADAVSIGNATWTSKSTTITLAAARTQTIDNCETAWTATNTATVTRTGPPAKQGSYYMSITMPATGAAANTKYAYYALPATLDLSAYQNISLRIAGLTAVSPPNTYWVIRLCSDTTGDTVVDSFTVQGRFNNGWTSVTIPRTGGGNLGATINSISIASSTSFGNSSNIQIDNIIATKTGDLDLNCLISKSSSNVWQTSEPWCPIMSIVGTTVTIDMSCFNYNQTYSVGSGGNKGYFTTGTSPETVTTYIKRIPLLYNLIGSTGTFEIGSASTCGGESTSANMSSIIGGWNLSTDTQDGMTWVWCFTNTAIYGSWLGYAEINNWGYVNAYLRTSNQAESGSGPQGFKNIYNIANGSTTAFVPQGVFNMKTGYYENFINGNSFSSYTDFATADTAKNIYVISSDAVISKQNGVIDGLTIYNSYYNIYKQTTINNLYSNTTNMSPFATYSSSQGFANVRVNNMTYLNGSSSMTYSPSQWPVYVDIRNLTTDKNLTSAGQYVTFKVFNSNYPVDGFGAYTNTTSLSQGTLNEAVGGNKDDNRIYQPSGNIISQTTTRHTASGIAWQFNVTLTAAQYYGQYVDLSIAKIACTGNKAVTVKAWVKKSNATSIKGEIYVDGYQLGLSGTDVVATKANDTNWEELTVTFTPTVASVIEIRARAIYVSSTTASVYVDDISVTEAA